MYGESMLSCIEGPALDENSGMIETRSTGLKRSVSKSGLRSARLSPLLIPQGSTTQPRLGSNSGSPLPPDVPPKSARMQNASPNNRGVRTPSSSTSTLVDTPLVNVEDRAPPDTNPRSRSASQKGHSRGQSENAFPRVLHRAISHRRGDSESSISAMDRGRLKKRAPEGGLLKRSPSKRSPSEEQRAFETLPQGYRATKASSVLATAELESLRKQAIGQASKFEVLPAKEVELLAKVSFTPFLTDHMSSK